MSESQLSHLSNLSYQQNNLSNSSSNNSFSSNSFIMDFISDLHPIYQKNLNSFSSLQLSQNSSSQNQDLNTMIVKKTEQNYQFADSISIKNHNENSYTESCSDQELPTEIWIMSEAITSAKESFIDNFKEKAYKASIHQSSFATPNKMFCPQCDCEVSTLVTLRAPELGLLQKFELFCMSFRCCVSQKINDNYELIHSCRKCKKVLVKISTE